MSEVINNREYRRETLKKLIMRLHDGEPVEAVQKDFQRLLKGITTEEIVELENSLVAEGMPVEEIQRLCDVHAAVFGGSVEEIHDFKKPTEEEGHPVDVFKQENRGIEAFIEDRLRPAMEEFRKSVNDESTEKLLKAVTNLYEIDKHYSRKENLLFPYMEKYGITTPPKVMWGVDDEIRDAIKEVIDNLKNKKDMVNILSKTENVINRVKDMIFKEENILFPMVSDVLTEDEWLTIQKESGEIGFCFIGDDMEEWKPERVDLEKEEKKKGEKEADGFIRFETGLLEIEELEQMLNTLPVDITFVDRNDTVKYFSQAKDRIFARPKTVIGRNVQNCHPPASVHVVEGIVNDFKSGKKDKEEFWIKMGEKYVYIRYFAVRDKEGKYLGTVEVTQDIKPIQEITGEKRLVE
ncbi:MAG: DUF438 domain-containing protein [Clostridiaceae bacterium]|jgi:PAS domain S-box-containing protein|nr:DUF438 domain-containing protein [Clostridiaceae bacterium]